MVSSWILPALFAAAIATGVTVAIERLGGRRGGLLGTLPSTIVPAAIGLLAVSPSLSSFQEAMFITPAGMLVNTLFLLMWRLLPPRLPNWGSITRLAVCLTLSLLGWALLAWCAIRLTTSLVAAGFGPSPMALCVIGVTILIGIIACKHNPPDPRTPHRVSIPQLLSRGLIAGTAIGLSVWLAGIAGPLIAGMAAVFPAIYLTTMCILWFTHGETVGAGAIGPMMLGGASVSTYAWLAAWWLPTLGPIGGTLAAWSVAVAVITIPSWLWLTRVGAKT
jgi:hypothetical protein